MPRRIRIPSPLPQEFRTREIADIKIMRLIARTMGFPETCHRAACRRKRSCASPTVACFDENIEVVREFAEGLADWARLDGPRDPAEFDRPVTKLLD